MQSSMSDDPRNRAPTDDPPYRLYRADPDDRPGRPKSEERPYTVYRSLPKGLRARLRGEEDIEQSRRRRDGGGDRPPGGRTGVPWWRRRVTPLRVLKYLVLAIVAWLALSFVLFLVSAQMQSGSLPNSASAALTSGGNMITSTDTVLVLGTDQRPKGTHEAGANTSDKGSRSDTIMLWRIGGGTSRRLSIPRDTLTPIPGFGQQKINAAYAIGGPALTIKTVEKFTGVKINHLIIVNLANFPKFIDAVGGVDVKTGRICSAISGGAKLGGFSLNLRPGTHHLTGIQALTLARTRENTCDAASNDLTREGYQQKILNSIKSKLVSPGGFFHLPWASWYAPQAVRTDMGGLTLLTLFAAAETGGSAPTRILKPTGAQNVPGVGDALIASPGDVHRAVGKLMNG
jgi:LCP family protein required for cell wall assembly